MILDDMEDYVDAIKEAYERIQDMEIKIKNSKYKQ